MQNTTQNVSPADQKTEAKVSHPNPHHPHALRNLNVKSYPYNLHTLQPEGMQEKTLVFLVNL